MRKNSSRLLALLLGVSLLFTSFNVPVLAEPDVDFDKEIEVVNEIENEKDGGNMKLSTKLNTIRILTLQIMPAEKLKLLTI